MARVCFSFFVLRGYLSSKGFSMPSVARADLSLRARCLCFAMPTRRGEGLRPSFGCHLIAFPHVPQCETSYSPGTQLRPQNSQLQGGEVWSVEGAPWPCQVNSTKALEGPRVLVCTLHQPLCLFRRLGLSEVLDAPNGRELGRPNGWSAQRMCTGCKESGRFSPATHLQTP